MMAVKDRRHWQFRVGRWRFERWCIGAPCHLVSDDRHRIRLFRAN